MAVANERELTYTGHFIKNPAFSAANMTVDKRGLIVFDC